MKIVVLSGKGGTGKTTLATNLSKVLKFAYVDCDVEEPNGHIFLKPEIEITEDVEILNPVFDTDKCVGCGACVKACQFNALAHVIDRVMLFDSLCHGCGACYLACSKGAISEVGRKIGSIETADSFYKGTLNIKEPMGGPVISRLNQVVNEDALFDAPPGTSCNVVKSLDDADYAILVTEPTRFGLHDLELAIELMKIMKIPFGIVENRSLDDEYMMTDFCQANKYTLLGRIPFSKEAARWYASGKMLLDHPKYKPVYEKLGLQVMEEVNGGSYGTGNH